MRPEDFRELLGRRPFQPFRLHLSNGADYEVRHPELALVARSVVWLDIPAPALSIPAGERTILVALIHIVQIDFLESGPPPSLN
jgi:hypothetical protein